MIMYTTLLRQSTSTNLFEIGNIHIRVLSLVDESS